ncbi:Bud-site selection protein [Atractiella rhizophila]|nr:Bud-site selection protein [Atractiella rhizophila]
MGNKRKRSHSISSNEGAPTRATLQGKGSSMFLPSLMAGYTSGDGRDGDYEFSGEEDFEDDDKPERKNRRGQRARRAIWEKKYGRGAKHLKTSQEAEVEAQDDARPAKKKKGDERREKEKKIKPSDARRKEKRAAKLGRPLPSLAGKVEQRQVPDRGEPKNSSSSRLSHFSHPDRQSRSTTEDRKPQQTRKEEVPLPQKGKISQEEHSKEKPKPVTAPALHPSWDAKRKQSDVVANALAGKSGGAKKIVFD